METYSLFIPTNVELVENFITEMTASECLLGKDYTITIMDKRWAIITAPTYNNYNIVRRAVAHTSMVNIQRSV